MSELLFTYYVHMLFLLITLFISKAKGIMEYETLAQTDPEEGINICLASEPRYPTRKIERSRLTYCLHCHK